MALVLARRAFGSSAAVAAKAVATASKPTSIAIAEENIPRTTMIGQSFVGDLRSTSGLGVGDGCKTHTSKWLQGDQTSPLEYIQATEPVKVHGLTVACYGVEDPALGAPVQYINLKGTTRDSPAVCKYTGNKYYSDDWVGGGAH